MGAHEENERQRAELEHDARTIAHLRNVEKLIESARALPLTMALGTLRALEFLAGRNAGPVAQRIGARAAEELRKLSGPDGA